MINARAVEAFVQHCKSTGQFGTISFIKKDGTIRTINGLFAPSSKIVGSERGVVQGDAMRKLGLIPIYDVKGKNWKCFSVNKVVAIA